MCPVEKKSIKSATSVLIIFSILSVVLVGLLLGIKAYGILGNKSLADTECSSDAECVASECCHSSSCVHISQAPDCKNAFCTMECREGTLDCGFAECVCISGKCSIQETNQI